MAPERREVTQAMELKQTKGDPVKIIEDANRYVKLLAAMERALTTANIPILLTDAGLKRSGPRIVFANQAFCESTGYSQEELVGESPRMLQGPRTDPALLRRLAEHLKQGLPFAGQTINYRKDGKPYQASWNISPICDDNGNVTHYVSFQTHTAAPARSGKARRAESSGRGRKAKTKKG